MAASDYTGRTVDYSILQGVTASGSTLLELDLISDENSGGSIATGTQKAAQTFVILLLTQKGSRVHDPDFGTRFISLLGRGVASDSQFKTSIQDAISDILRQQRKYADDDAADDEIINDIKILSFATPSPDYVQLNVEIETRAGSTRQVILPIPLVIK